MFKQMENKNEEQLLNWYLLFGWTVIAGILVVTYAVEVVKGAFVPMYYFMFLCVTVIPFLVCGIKYKKDSGSTTLRYWIFVGYFLMYGFVLLTGHTNLVFTYIFPLMSLIVLYHDSKLVVHVGGVTLILNIAAIVRDYYRGKITVINSRDYEIQIALIVLCFFGAYVATKVYDRISEINKKKEDEVLHLQEERIILEERNRYAFIDSLTELGNRRKYEDSLDYLREHPSESCYIVMIDINGLKRANDTIGHMAGDEMIAGTAHCIKTAFAEDGDEGFRFGGDEFAVFSRSDEKTLEQKLKRLRESIDLWKGIHVSQMHVAIGYALFEKGRSVEEVLKLADKKMYINKKDFYAQGQNDRRRRS